MSQVRRYSPTLDWCGCYYECDEPSASMEESLFGEWVDYSDYKALHKANLHLADISNQAIDEIKELQSRLLNLQSKLDKLTQESEQDQFRKWTEHQRPL